MTDPSTHDDELVSAVLDGEATEAERARVTADPVLAARLAEFETVARQVGGPVDAVDDAARERMIAAAVRTATMPADDDVVAIDPARARRRRGPSRPVLVAAAAVVGLLALAGGLLAVGDGDDDADQVAVAGGEADSETAGDIAMPDLDLGAVDDPETLRLRVGRSTGLGGDAATEAEAFAAEDSSGATAPESAPDDAAPAPADDEEDLRAAEDCTIELVEGRPELIGQLAEGTVTYQGQAGYVFVYNDADLGGAVGIVTSTADCRVLVEVAL
jgi:hypothetical protein